MEGGATAWRSKVGPDGRQDADRRWWARCRWLGSMWKRRVYSYVAVARGISMALVPWPEGWEWTLRRFAMDGKRLGVCP